MLWTLLLYIGTNITWRSNTRIFNQEPHILHRQLNGACANAATVRQLPLSLQQHLLYRSCGTKDVPRYSDTLPLSYRGTDCDSFPVPSSAEKLCKSANERFQKCTSNLYTYLFITVIYWVCRSSYTFCILCLYCAGRIFVYRGGYYSVIA